MVRFGFVLAGGASARMGRDKARVCYPGEQPMAVVVAEAMRAAGLHPTLVRGVDDGPFIGLDGAPIPVILDGGGARHPLFGVAAALAAATEDLVCIAPCDLAFLDGASIGLLCAFGGECFATDGARDQPLLAVLHRRRAAACRAAAIRGAAVMSVLGGLPPVRLTPAALQNRNAMPSDAHTMRS